MINAKTRRRRDAERHNRHRTFREAKRLRDATSQARIAARLFLLLASGGTVERAVIEFPAFKTQIESAFEWLKSKAQSAGAETEYHVRRWRELECGKWDAIRKQEYDLAAELREKECGLLRSLGFEAPMAGHVGVEEEMQRLSALLHEIRRTDGGSRDGAT